VRHACPTCQEHGTPCYFALKQRSGLFKRKDAATNGHRNALDPRQWLIVGVDLSPPPRDLRASPADLYVQREVGWSDYREQSAPWPAR
jgi:hypothetical protein